MYKIKTRPIEEGFKNRGAQVCTLNWEIGLMDEEEDALMKCSSGLTYVVEVHIMKIDKTMAQSKEKMAQELKDDLIQYVSPQDIQKQEVSKKTAYKTLQKEP